MFVFTQLKNKEHDHQRNDDGTGRGGEAFSANIQQEEGKSQHPGLYSEFQDGKRYIVRPYVPK